MLLLITGIDTAHVGFDPDLQEMHEVAVGGVVFAVAYARARAHALHVARADHRSGPDRVLVGETTFEHVTDDFHVAVPVGAETLARLHAVFVDDAQRPEPHGRG